MAEFEMNGRRYRELPDGNVQDIGPSSGGRVIPKSATTQRKEGAEADKTVVDAQTGAAELPYVGPQAAANLGKTGVETAVTQTQLSEAEEKNARGNIGDDKRQSALRAYTSADYLERLADKLEREYGRNLGRTSGLGGAADFLPTGDNTRINTLANSSRGYLKSALGFTGGEGNAAIEQENNYGSFIPNNWDSNEAAVAKIENLRNLARQSRVESISFLGGVPDAAGRIDRLPQGLNQNQLDRLYGGSTLAEAMGVDDTQGLNALGETGSATSNGGFQKVPGLGGLPRDVIRMVRRGASADDILKHLDEAYKDAGVEGSLAADPSTKAWLQGVINDHAANPNAPISTLSAGWDRLTGYEAPQEERGFLGDLLDAAQEGPAGAGVISAANAVTGGNLANLAGGDAGDVMSAMRRDNWKSSLGGDILGSGLAMYGINRLGGPLLSRGAGVGGDMLYGGTRGFSETEGDFGDRAVGGIFGLAAAGIGNQAGQHLLAPTLRGIGNSAPGRTVADLIANTGTGVGNAYRGIRGQSPAPYQGAGIPQASVTQAVIARNLPEDVDPIAAALAEGRAIGMPLTVADVSPGLRNIGGAAFRRADQGTQERIAQQLTDRARGQAGRAQNQIEAAFGPLDDPLQASQSLLTNARTSAAPLYDDFRAQPSRTSPELEAMLATPAGQRALANAQTIAGNEGRDLTSMGFGLDDMGQVALRQDPSPETLDLVKRGLDDVLEGYRDPVTGRLNLDEGGRAVEGLRQRYVSELDRLYPQYAQARAAYAGPASENAALLAGQQMVGKHPRQVGQRLEGLNDGQLEQFRLGQRTAMGDAVQGARTSADPYQRIWGDPLDYERASMVFGQPAASRFQRAFDAEQAMTATRNAFIGGSPTQARQALDDQLGDQIGGQVASAAIDVMSTGSPAAAGLGLMQRYLRNRNGLGFQGAREGAASEIAQLLATERPVDEVAALLAESAAYRRYVDDLRTRSGHLGGSLVPGLLATGGAYE